MKKYIIILDDDECYFVKRPMVMTLAQFKRNVIIKYGIPKQIKALR